MTQQITANENATFNRMPLAKCNMHKPPELQSYSRCIPLSACIPPFGKQILWRDYINKHPDTAPLPRHHRPPIKQVTICPCTPDSLCVARCSPYWPDLLENAGVILPTCDDNVCDITSDFVRDNATHCHLRTGHPNPGCAQFHPRDIYQSPYARYILESNPQDLHHPPTREACGSRR